MSTISFQLPDNIDRQLRDQVGDLDAVAKEAALVELYRQSKLSRRELGIALNLTRFEVDGLLNSHQVTEDLVTLEEHNAELAAAKKLIAIGASEPRSGGM